MTAPFYGEPLPQRGSFDWRRNLQSLPQIGPPDPIQTLLAARDPRNAANAALLDPMQQYPGGLLAPASPPPMPPAPYAPKPSIVDRVAARLFPTGAYQGLLDPQAQQGLQRQGLMNLSTNLLQAGGAAPYQRGTLANIGASLQGVNFPEMAQQALQLQNYRSQQQDQQLIAAAGARHPAQPGENRSQAYDRITAILSDIISIPGGDAIAAKLAPVLAALKPDKLSEPQQIRDIVDTRLGSPTIGQSGTFLIPFPGAPRETWSFIKGEPKVGAAAKPNAALLTGNESRAAATRLLTAEADGQGIEQASPGAAQPSTWAAFLGGLTAKVAGEHAGTGVTQALRGSVTNQYQAAAGRWVDAYMQLLPKSRQGSTALRQQIQRTYWGQEGDDPGNVQAKAQARKAATAALARAVATGTPPPLPGFEPEAP